MMVYRSVIYFRRTILSGLHKMRSNLIIKNSGPLGKHGSEINAFFTLPPCRKRYLGGKQDQACAMACSLSLTGSML